MNQRIWSYCSLFFSLGTLVCCALPALLVFLGLGAVLAGIVATVPQIVWLSQYKIYLFAVAGIVLVISTVSYFRTRKIACTMADANLKAACGTIKGVTSFLLLLSGLIYLVGFTFAFILPYLGG